MAKTSFLVGFVFSLLFVSIIAYPLQTFAQGPDNTPGKPEVFTVSGIIPEKNLLVHIWVVAPPGTDRSHAAASALASQGARPFSPAEYSQTGLVWDQFSDGIAGNDFVTQNYNPKGDPTGGNGLTALLNTHNSWNGVSTSAFEFAYGGETGRCPSLVQECRGPQTLDGNNDVAWLAIRDPYTLGVTWSSSNNDEADMALNTNFNWATDGVTNYDVETVLLHENGHVAGLGHSDDINAIMYPSYQKPTRVLQQDDINGISALYPISSTNDSPTVLISSPSDNSSFDSASVISFAGSASDTEDGDLSAYMTWTSDIDGAIGTGSSFSSTLSDGQHVITAQVTDSGGKTSTTSVTITVGTQPLTGTTASVDSITYSIFGGKNNDKNLSVTIHVSDDLENNVAGASVSILLSRGNNSWVGTATTDSVGNVGFTLGNSPPGTYTTTITNVVADGLTWDGLTPDNSFSK